MYSVISSSFICLRERVPKGILWYNYPCTFTTTFPDTEDSTSERGSLFSHEGMRVHHLIKGQRNGKILFLLTVRRKTHSRIEGDPDRTITGCILAFPGMFKKEEGKSSPLKAPCSSLLFSVISEQW